MGDVEPGSTDVSTSAKFPVDSNNQQVEKLTTMDSQTCVTGTACATATDTVSSGLAIGLGSFYGKNSRNKRKPLRFDD